jgi:hypothetical protein
LTSLTTISVTSVAGKLWEHVKLTTQLKGFNSAILVRDRSFEISLVVRWDSWRLAVALLRRRSGYAPNVAV